MSPAGGAIGAASGTIRASSDSKFGLNLKLFIARPHLVKVTAREVGHAPSL